MLFRSVKFLPVLFLALCLPLAGEAREVSEYSVKAAYLFNFTKFVDWPPKTFTNEKDPLVIGVLGEDPFGEVLDRAVENKTVNGHGIKVVRFDEFDQKGAGQLRQCQILFICYSEKERLTNILRSLKGSNVLTVSEIENFPLVGGVIQFDQVGRRINLVINPDAAKDANLGISARLLQVSRIYKAETP